MHQAEVMLATKTANGFASDSIRWPMLASRKMDGMRLLCWGGQLLTRTLKPQPNKALAERLKPLTDKCLKEGIVLDGEIYSHHHAFDVHQSVIRSENQDLPSQMHYLVFDGMPLEEWGCCPRSFEERQSFLHEVLPSLGESSSCPWGIVDQFEVYDSSDAQQWMDQWIQSGYEGLMLRSPSSSYKHGRATVREGTFFKFKQSATGEARIVDILERRQMIDGASGSRGLTPGGKLERVHKKDMFIGSGKIGAVMLLSPEWPGRFKATFARGHKPEETWGLTWENRLRFLGRLAKFKYQPQGVKNVPRMARIFEIGEHA